MCDVYIDSGIPDAAGIAERLNNEAIFSSVFCGAAVFKTRYKHLGLRWVLSKRFRDEIKDDLVACFPSLARRCYDVLVCSSAMPQTLALKRYFVSDGYSVFFDDGSGSHNGNVFKPFYFQDDVLSDSYDALGVLGTMKASAKRIARAVPFLDFRFQIKALWLFSPTPSDFAIYKNMEIHPIPIPEDQELLRRVISPFLDRSNYTKKRFIFLSTSRTAPDSVKQIEVELVKWLYEAFGKQAGIRIHPNRDVVDFIFCQDAILPSNDSWELLLLCGALDENTVLLGYGSSAQLHPKTLCGLEPHVIFLYKVLNPGGNESTISFEQTALALRESYINKERISIPESLEELHNDIQQCVSNE